MTHPDLLDPQIISIHHDGIEVARNDRGRWMELPESFNNSPTTIEFFFNGVLVYQIQSGVVLVNTMTQLLQAQPEQAT